MIYNKNKNKKPIHNSIHIFATLSSTNAPQNTFILVTQSSLEHLRSKIETRDAAWYKMLGARAL